MRNSLIRIVYGIVLFFAAVVLLEMFTKQGAVEVASPMGKAALPVVSVYVDKAEINEMHGYKEERDIGHFRTVCTPIYEDRSVTFFVRTYGTKVTDLSFAVRSIDGTRLVEDNPVTSVEEAGEGILAGNIVLKDLLEENEEYMMILTMKVGGESVHYYTRIKPVRTRTFRQASDFVMRFHKAALTGTNASMIKKALEPKSNLASDSYALVTINDTYEKVSYGELTPLELADPMILLRDLQNETAILELTYMLSVYEGMQAETFRCTEYYRVRIDEENNYLLDYRRTMEQYFNPKNTMNYADKRIRLGLTDNAALEESDAGTNFAFIAGGSLYSCMPSENEVSTVFTYAAPGSFDLRENNREYDIKILNVDETGMIDFMVYGYHNRGPHEGRMGIWVLSYNHEYKTVEENVFIPYSGSYEILKSQIEELSYYNKNGELYLLVDEAVYVVDLSSNRVEMLVDSLKEEQWKVSDSGQMIAWKSASLDDGDEADRLTVLDFSTKQLRTITASPGERVFSLGFIGEDYIYGTAKVTDSTRTTVETPAYPMYRMTIVDSNLQELAVYQKTGKYIRDISVEDSQIVIKRVARNYDGAFVEIADDTVLAGIEPKEGKNRIVRLADEAYGRVTAISVKGLKEGGVRSAETKLGEHAGSNNLYLPASDIKGERFFVYGAYGAVACYDDLSAAIRRAEVLRGNVVDSKGHYRWVAGNRMERNQIMAFSGTPAAPGESTVAVCLRAVASYEGVGMNPEAALREGKTVIEILEESIPGCRAFDLSGCSLDSALYYVSCEKPVFALSENGEQAVLIVGYNSEICVVMDPATGELERVGRTEMEQRYSAAGAGYICYIRD